MINPEITYRLLIKKYVNNTGQRLEQGDVVVHDYSDKDIDAVKLPANAEDIGIAGVVSAASRPGQPVYCIHFGRSYIKVDATGGNIVPGSTLCTKAAGSTLAKRTAAPVGIVAIAAEKYEPDNPETSALILADIVAPVGYASSLIAGNYATTEYVDNAVRQFAWKPPVNDSLSYIHNSAPSTAGSTGEFLLDTTNEILYKYNGTSWEVVSITAGDRYVFNMGGSNNDYTNTYDNKIYEYNGSFWADSSPSPNSTIVRMTDDVAFTFDEDTDEWVQISSGSANISSNIITLNATAPPATPDADKVKIYLQDMGDGEKRLMVKFEDGSDAIIASVVI